MFIRKLLPIFTVICALGLAACGPKPITPQLRPVGTIAVAAFTAPKYNWELLAGYLPEEGKTVKPEILANLDGALNQSLRAHGVSIAGTPAAVRQCQEIMTLERTGKARESAWSYWLGVGRCLPADFILVPQVLGWKELEGGGNPAAVVMDLYLIDVKGQRLVSRYHYDETQKALTDNLLDLGKFVKRKGEWVNADVLAKEGIEAGLREMGL
ncbi:MAG TPA: hypothetical protein VN419_13510 [Humidesulfovibrio sp.]|uniref:hypothetical protein n=1 Tax=Humidesulfovibrio sp. TaxID=2910988 RepID=UPI002C8D42C3|nr:hypothetical protein [Humidesulfovibrio sp.]HWR05016.1 hypothetical protein [Humidesulfovibrio sp.]